MKHRDLLPSLRSPRSARSWLGLSLLGLSLLDLGGCANQPGPALEPRAVAVSPGEMITVPTPAVAERTEPVLRLDRQLHVAPMREVVLDPRAEAALTLDIDGGVRLWTQLRSADARAPLFMPAHEPGWMSLARSEGGLVAGFVDTAGGARVVEVEIDGAGAQMSTLFEIPTTDPLFELHVLDGGARILVLGIDHRVRLYDREGTEISVLEPAGFVPWQLRVQQPMGEPPAIVAVLAGPTRVQRITLDGDRLALVGEPRTVEIDQGPNRNDLSLSPDGRTVVAMRRPKARSTRLTFELVDLPTDARRLVAAQVDSRDRPRVLLVDGERALLESGTGRGFWLDLSAAVPWTVGTSREQTEDLPATAMPEIGLAGSTTARRMHVTMVGGVRALTAAHELIVDPIHEDRHTRLGAKPLRPGAVALDPSGTRVAWSAGDSIVIDDGVAADTLHTVPCPVAQPVELAFVGEDRLLVLGHDGRAKIIEDAQGQVVSSTRLPVGWGLAEAGFLRGEHFDEGTLALMTHRPKDPIHVVDVVGGDFAEPRDVPRWQRTQWPSMGIRARDARGVLDALGFDALAPESVGALVEDHGGHYLVADSTSLPTLHWISDEGARAFALRGGLVRQLLPAPKGTKVAVFQRIDRSERLSGVTGGTPAVVSVYDVETEQRLWSRSIEGVADLEWDHAGERLAVAAHDGGYVLEASTGAQVLVRRHRGLQAIEGEDPGRAGVGPSVGPSVGQ
ncbi:MAG: hypothetical protein AAGF11_31530 [Myxococcota bacterium]